MNIHVSRSETDILLSQLREEIESLATSKNITETMDLHSQIQREIKKLITFIITDEPQYSVTYVCQHAVDAFRKRTGTKKTDGQIRAKLLLMVASGEEVEIGEKFRLKQILSHHGERARYINSSGWILVVVENRIKTVHNGSTGKWKR